MFPRVSLRTAIVCAIACSLPLSFQVSAAGKNKHKRAAKREMQSDRLIIRFKDSVSFAQADQLLKRLQYRQQERPNFVRGTANRGMVFKFRKKKRRQEWADIKKWLKTNQELSYVEVDEVLQPVSVTPNDAYFHHQWPLTEANGGINIMPSWEQNVSGAGSVVAVIDTGYRPHVDLVPNLLPGYDMITNSSIANDGDGRDADASDPGDYFSAGECGATYNSNSSWHGTHVAGTVAAAMNNNEGISGVAYNAKILPVRALGKCGGYVSDIADSILWASGNEVSGVPVNQNPAQVINLSLGSTGSCSTTLQRAIDLAVAKNSVVVAAAGNNNGDAGQFNPANCNNVISVAASNRKGGKAAYTNTGTVVDITAPGDDVLSTINTGRTTPENDSYASYQGTSMAAPHVAGVAALMLSANPELNPAQVESIIKDNARPFPAACNNCGTGIVDASAAVSIAISLATGSRPGNPEEPETGGNEIEITPEPAPEPAPQPEPAPEPAPQPEPAPEPEPEPEPEPAPELSITGMSIDTLSVRQRMKVTISGSGFTNGMKIRFKNGTGRKPRIFRVVVVDDQTATAIIKARGSKRSKRTHVWDMMVKTQDGNKATLPDALTITPYVKQ